MLGPERRAMILELVDEKNFIGIAQLATALNASEPTIRRDLAMLEKEQKLMRIRGGAQRVNAEKAAPRQHLTGSVFLADKERNTQQKRMIAKRAVGLCQDNESIIINGGSSTYMMAEFLVNRELNILTNSFPLAHTLIETSENRITLPGGEYYPKQKLILSSFDNDTIKHYRGVRMFMGTPGIGRYGVMESDPLLVRSELKLLQQADELVHPLMLQTIDRTGL